MIAFTIQQLESWTLIKGHTMRMWEQRHSAFAPQRNERHQRLYDPQAIQRALCLALLTRQQAAIAQLVNRPLAELHALTEPLWQADQPLNQQLIGLLMAIAQDDAHQFEQRLLACWHRVGGLSTLRELVLPLLQRLHQVDKTSEAWTPWLTLLEQQVLGFLHQLPRAWRTDTPYLLVQLQPGLPPLPLHIAQYLLLSQGYPTTTLSAHPFPTVLRHSLDQHQPRYVLVFLESWPALHQVQAYVDELAVACANTSLWLTGDRVVGQDLCLPRGVQVLNRLEGLPLHQPT